MGRQNTGALEGREVMRLEMSLIKTLIPKGDGMRAGSLNWSSGSNMSYLIRRDGLNIDIRLRYTQTKNGEKKDYDYTIDIIPTPSNLGFGYVYHFRCPVTWQPSKILYLCYGSSRFMSRAGYLKHGVRIYYPSQLSGYYDRPNDKFWYLERYINEMEEKHPKTHYRGELTKPRERIERLKEKRDYYDSVRWYYLPLKLRAILPMYDIPI